MYTDLTMSPRLIFCSIFVTCLIIADVIGVKLFEIPLPFEILGHKTVEHTCGMLTFPVTFLLGDLINEYYGNDMFQRTVHTSDFYPRCEHRQISSKADCLHRIWNVDFRLLDHEPCPGVIIFLQCGYSILMREAMPYLHRPCHIWTSLST